MTALPLPEPSAPIVAPEDVGVGLIILNPAASGMAEWAEHLSALAQARGYTMVETTSPQDVAGLLDAVRPGQRVLAAGGDGTVRCVVQALSARPSTSPFGVLPLGTGNDAARTLRIPLNDPAEALSIIARERTAMYDLLCVTTAEQTLHVGLNASVAGGVVQATGALDPQKKKAWGGLSYIPAGVRALGDLQRYDVTLTGPDGVREQYRLLGLALANGRTCAGGWPIAPEADPTDGLLDLVMLHDGPMSDVLDALMGYLRGEHMRSPLVEHRRVSHLSLESDPPMPINLDGELIGDTPVTISLLPGRLPVIVGDDFFPQVVVAEEGASGGGGRNT